MLVYGDGNETVATARLVADLRRKAGIWLPHDALRDRFIALAGLTQGVADADFEAFGLDRERSSEQALLHGLVALAAVLLRSWDEGCTGGAPPPLPEHSNLPAKVTIREAEGYAHYALYPEAYGLAARKLVLDAPPLVIGLRSIGSGLAAMAAAALDAPPPITLRPGGDPFARSLAIAPELERKLLEQERHFVIVDEGPGLSGSSFGCVADWLEERGVAADRIAFLPGHGGDLGIKAAPRHRERWQRAQRPVAKPDRLGGWIADLVGTVEEWHDLSGGAWRPHWRASEADWPAVVPNWERMKFRVRGEGRSWLVRFAGLGSGGREKLDLARLLHRRGYGPEIAGLTHGWLVQRWHEDARPTRPTLAELTAYLDLRAELSTRQGASLDQLVTMVRRNVPELRGWYPPTEMLQALVQPVKTDGRLHAHEWLRLPDGQLLKADALDHHRGHDLIGAQDIAWDVAGAITELRLCPAVEAEPRLTAFYRVAYCAFQIGVHGLGESISGEEERHRHRAATARYRSALVDAVEHLGNVDQSLGRGIEALA